MYKHLFPDILEAINARNHILLEFFVLSLIKDADDAQE